jgi:hypothetical protein
VLIPFCSEEDSNEGEMVEVLERRFLNLSRPLRILRVAETRVVVWGAEVVLGWETLLRLKRDLLPNNYPCLSHP